MLVTVHAEGRNVEADYLQAVYRYEVEAEQLHEWLSMATRDTQNPAIGEVIRLTAEELEEATALALALHEVSDRLGRLYNAVSNRTVRDYQEAAMAASREGTE